MLSLLNSPLGFATTPPQAAEQNPCRAGKAEGATPGDNKSELWKALADVQCSAAISGGGVQSGADETLGRQGTLVAGLSPITASYASQDMCAAPAPALHQPNHVHCRSRRQPQKPLSTTLFPQPISERNARMQVPGQRALAPWRRAQERRHLLPGPPRQPHCP